MNVGSFSANNTKDIKLKKSNVKVEEDNVKVYRSAVPDPNFETVELSADDEKFIKDFKDGNGSELN